jgi:methylated-DNA-protein-cysteine methyltransferase-like protein
MQSKFFKKIYKIVAKIPYGKVCTYGQIARYVGAPRSARTIGWALHIGPKGLPYHRVVNRFGALTGKFAFGDENLMKNLLEAEGVEFTKDSCVNLQKHLWEISEKKKIKKKKIKN